MINQILRLIKRTISSLVSQNPAIPSISQFNTVHTPLNAWKQSYSRIIGIK